MSATGSADSARGRRNLFVVVATSFISGLEVGIVNVIWQPFVLSFGVPLSVLGMLTSISGWNGIIPTLMSPFGGWFADRRGRKILLLAASAALIASYALYTLAGVTGLVAFLVPGIILAGASAISRPVSSALTGESVRAGRQASAFSLVMFANTLAGMLAPLGVGVLADRAGYAAGFPVAMLAELVAFAFVARFLWQPPIMDKARVESGEIAQLLRRAFVPLRGLEGFFAICAMDSFSWGMGYSLFFGLMSKQFHFDAFQLGILLSVMNASWALMQLPIGRFIDVRGCKPILVLSEALGPPLLLLWMTQSRFEMFVLSMPLFAVNAALWVPARNTYLTRATPTNGRAEAFGRLVAFTGAVAFPASFIGGLLYDHWGYAAPFLANMIGSIITVFAIILLVREPRTKSFEVSPG